MKRFITLMTMALLGALLYSCNGQEKTENAKPPTNLNPGLTPLLKLDHDTIQSGDSLTGIIGAVFHRSITEKERQQLINTIRYRIDTVQTGDTVYYKLKRLNDSTFRFAIFTQSNNTSLSKRSFHASLKVQFYDSNNQIKDYIFRNQFEYYIKK